MPDVVRPIAPHRGGFTLVELLVVIGIIAVLVGVLMPSLTLVRRASLRTACAAQLRDIGNAFQMYLGDSKGRIPNKLNPLPLQNPPMVLGNLPTLFEVFNPYLTSTRRNTSADRLKIWVCPADRIRAFDKDASLAGFERYADAYGTSYEYNFFMNSWRPFTPFKQVLYDAQFTPVLGTPLNITPTKFRVFGDLTTFHGPVGRPGNMNFLFADWHVGDLEGEVPAGTLSPNGT